MAQTAAAAVSQVTGQGISRIEVRELFGRYTYQLSVPAAPTADLSRVLVIYGDNGSGKTTILRLLFHLLSPSGRRGHRTFLARTPFRLFEVSFVGGLTIRASRPDEPLSGPYWLQIVVAGQISAQLYVETDETHRVPPTGTDDLDTFMDRVNTSVGLEVYYVGDDRTMESDTLPAVDDDIRFTPSRHESGVFRAEIERSLAHTREVFRQRHVFDLDETVDRATSWLREQVIGASNLGGESTNAIYAEVVRRLAKYSLVEDSSRDITIDDLRARLDDLGSRNERYQRYGLVPPLPETLAVDLASATVDSRDVLATVLVPFLDGLEARLDALASVQETIEAFTDNLNRFYTDKRVHFSLHTGIRIEAAGGARLSPSQLSSGERQLLLLLTNTLYARERPALFIIDEPEISLNMKWQRQLVDSLITCTAGSATQFVLASHSFELISGVRDRVVHLTQGIPQKLTSFT